jgi:uncharacterized alpha/beta hydrolase family protein
MIRWMRSAQIAGGKTMQAISWIKELQGYLKEKYDFKVEVFGDVFGDVGTVRWIVDYENLTALENAHKQIQEDQEYWQKLEKTSDLFIQGKVYDVVMRLM